MFQNSNSQNPAEVAEARIFYAYVEKYQDQQPLYKNLLGK